MENREDESIPRVPCDGEVGLETELAGKRGHHLTLVAAIARERLSDEQSLERWSLYGSSVYLDAHLNEELRIEHRRGRIEWSSLRYRRVRTRTSKKNGRATHGDGRVNVILSCNGVARQQVDNLVWRKPGVGKARNDLVDGVERIRNQIRRRGGGDI
jgi:hypothetical protein